MVTEGTGGKRVCEERGKVDLEPIEDTIRVRPLASPLASVSFTVSVTMSFKVLILSYCLS